MFSRVQWMFCSSYFFFSVAFLSNMQICLFLISLLLFLGNKNIETCRRSLLFRLFFSRRRNRNQLELEVVIGGGFTLLGSSRQKPRLSEVQTRWLGSSTRHAIQPTSSENPGDPTTGFSDNFPNHGQTNWDLNYLSLNWIFVFQQYLLAPRWVWCLIRMFFGVQMTPNLSWFLTPARMY